MARQPRFRNTKYLSPRISTYAERYLPGYHVLNNKIEPTGGFEDKVIERWRRQANRFPNQPKIGYFYPSANGHSDPLSIMLVLDAIMNLECERAFTAGGLHEILEEHYPQVRWDAMTVGRILSEIATMARKATRPGNEPAFDRWNNGGHHYHQAGPEWTDWLWLGCLREWFGGLAGDRIDRWRQKEKLYNAASLYDEASQVIEHGDSPNFTTYHQFQMRYKDLHGEEAA